MLSPLPKGGWCSRGRGTPAPPHLSGVIASYCPGHGLIPLASTLNFSRCVHVGSRSPGEPLQCNAVLQGNLSVSSLQLSELMREKRQGVEKDHERKMERMKEEHQEVLARIQDQYEEEVLLGESSELGGHCNGSVGLCLGWHCCLPGLLISTIQKTGGSVLF